MKACNQRCPWNTLYGCQKPESEPCILSNMACEKFEPKPQTNADHIRSLSDEELALFLCGVYDEDDGSKFICGYTIPEFDEDRIADWLKAPYEEDT